jgi:hypothetical protein
MFKSTTNLLSNATRQHMLGNEGARALAQILDLGRKGEIHTDFS